MTDDLKEVGVDVGHRRVGRLMRENGIVVERTRKFKTTTDSDHTFNIAPNLLDRDFTADGPNQKWPYGGASTGYRLTGGRYQLHLDPRGLAVSCTAIAAANTVRTITRSCASMGSEHR